MRALFCAFEARPRSRLGPPPAHNIHYSFADYLALERSSNVKHELLARQIYGTPEHAALKAAITGLLFAQIRGGRCRLHDADLRLRVPETGLATYPDLTVICGPLERRPEDQDAVTNPTLIVEVLSPSTAEYDRGDKFEHYKRLASLRQYVLVSHLERLLEVWSRSTSGEWTHALVRAGERANLDSIGAVLDAADAYAAAQEPRA